MDPVKLGLLWTVLELPSFLLYCFTPSLFIETSDFFKKTSMIRALFRKEKIIDRFIELDSFEPKLVDDVDLSCLIIFSLRINTVNASMNFL
jgi:hypothetical protein